MSATGLRSIRYARELPVGAVHSIVANDFDPAAVQAITRNIEFNFLDTEEPTIVDQQAPPPVIPNLGNAVFEIFNLISSH